MKSCEEHGNDDLFGTNRDDEIFGLEDGTIFAGAMGTIWSSEARAADRTDGGSGRDAIFGGTGRDLLYRGAGADDFWFDTRNSYDIIEDFGRGDALVIDAGDGTFEGVRRRDIDIDRGSMRTSGSIWLVS